MRETQLILYNEREIRRMLDAALIEGQVDTLAFDLGVEDSHYPTRQTKDERIRYIIKYASSRGKIERLFDFVKQVNNVQFSQFEERLRQAEHQTEQANTSLQHLSQWIDDPQVPITASTRSVANFASAHAHIVILSNYKDVHDILHTIQQLCFDRIVSEARRFPDDDRAHEELRVLEGFLEHWVSRLEGIAGHAIERQVQIRLVHGQLTVAQARLDNALRSTDTALLNQAIGVLGNVLALYPSQFNNYLNKAASTLDLPELVDAMRQVQNDLKIVDEHKAALFEKGVDALASFALNLSILIQEHNSWQEADDALRTLDPANHTFLEELSLNWPILKVMVLELCTNQTVSWAQEVSKDAVQVDAAITEGNLSLARQYFRRFRNGVRQHFYDVDVTLKKLCDQLRSVGEALDPVLRKLT